MIVLTYYVQSTDPDMPNAIEPRLPAGVTLTDDTSAPSGLGKPVLVICGDADAPLFDASYFLIMSTTDLNAVPPAADVDAFIAMIESWGVTVSPTDKVNVAGMTRGDALDYAKLIMRGL